tara:strand:+ start:431 stop:898 length:468 start_codon:yes stop_codon:yes gene_type:complete
MPDAVNLPEHVTSAATMKIPAMTLMSIHFDHLAKLRPDAHAAIALVKGGAPSHIAADTAETLVPVLLHTTRLGHMLRGLYWRHKGSYQNHNTSTKTTMKMMIRKTAKRTREDITTPGLLTHYHDMLQRSRKGEGIDSADQEEMLNRTLNGTLWYS